MRHQLTILAALAAVSFLPPAKAADIAEHRILGFSPDSRVFAFEEFGIQDGSGFPFANIYFIDTETDSWLPGTPVRVLLDDMTAVESGEADLTTARHTARKAASGMIEEHGIEDRWLTLAHSPLGEIGTSATELPFGIQPRWSGLADIEDRFRAEIEIYYAESPGQDCVAYMGDRATGFRLTISNLTSNDTAILHEDDSIPRSRGCPITYRISRIVAPDAWPVEQVVVVLSVLRHGFEGADRRFIAIPGLLP
jgi:predicted secreted protein